MPISNITPEIREAMTRRARGQSVGNLTEVNPPTSPVPSTVPSPSQNIGGGGMPIPSSNAPQAGASGAGGVDKNSNDTRIIEALITYLRKKSL